MTTDPGTKPENIAVPWSDDCCGGSQSPAVVEDDPCPSDAVENLMDNMTAEDPAPSWSLSALARGIMGIGYRNEDTGRVETAPDTPTSIKRAIQQTFHWRGMKIECANGDALVATTKTTNLERGRVKVEWTITRKTGNA